MSSAGFGVSVTIIDRRSRARSSQRRARRPGRRGRRPRRDAVAAPESRRQGRTQRREERVAGMDETATDEDELGATAATTGATMIARASTASCQTRHASVSPRATRRATSSASPTRPVASDQRRPIAPALERASRQPRWPHAQSGPSGTTTTCPISPVQSDPVTSCPRQRTALARPVPSGTKSTLSTSRAAPRRCSASRPERTSWPIATGTSTWAAMVPRRSRSRQPRFADHTPMPVTSSTRPGTTTPRASRSRVPGLVAGTGPTLVMSATTVLAATSPSGSPTRRGSVDRLGEHLPSGVTRADLIRVPPTSIPTTAWRITRRSL